MEEITLHSVPATDEPGEHRSALDELHSVTATAEDGCYICSITVTDDYGTETVDYVSRANDPFGIAPEVRAAVDKWIADGKAVLPAA